MRDHSTTFNETVAINGLILLAEVGSTVHGTNLDGLNDLDLQGICIESPGTILGHRGFDQWQSRTHADGTRIPDGERSGPGDTDKTVYGLRKWTSLAVKGNPTVLLPLYVPSENLHYVNHFGHAVRREREMFLSKNIIPAFRGYLTRQTMNAFSDAKHTNRPELVAKFGFDTKSAYHALRLAIQGRELLTYHKMEIPILKGRANFLLRVRRGEIPLEEVMRAMKNFVDDFDYASRHTTLPDKPDMHAIDTWVTGMYVTFWKERNWL